MSRLFGTNIDLNKNQLLNAVIQNLTSDPGSPVEGQVWMDTTNHVLKFRNNSATIIVGRLDQISAPTASVDLNSQKITGLGAPTLTGDAATRGYVLGLKVTDLTAPTGSFDLNGQKITGLGTPTLSTDAATRGYVLGLKVTDLTAPSGSFSMNSQKITNLLDGTAATDAATVGQVTAASAGLDPKASVRAASTATVTVTYSATGGTSGRGQITAAPNTLDGVSLAANDRILLKNQSTAAQNGIWVVTTLGSGANGVWDRATDMDADSEATGNVFMFVEEGTVNADTGWVLTTNNPIIVGGASGTSLAFAKFSAAATGATKVTATGPGSPGTTWAISHNLGTQDVIVQIRDASTNAVVEPDEVQTDGNTTTLTFGASVSANAYKAVIVG